MQCLHPFFSERISIDSWHKETASDRNASCIQPLSLSIGEKRTVGRYRVPISVQATRRERFLFIASPSNFPDDKSLWNSSKAGPIRRWTMAWRREGNFWSFHRGRERTSWRGDSAASAFVVTFTWMYASLLFSFTASDSRLLDSSGPIFLQQRFITCFITSRHLNVTFI